MTGHDTYQQLRHLTLPIAAVTTAAGGRRNGFIVNSAQRASLVPDSPRISLYVSKPNVSHDLIYRSGVLGVHLLRNDQFDVIEALGMNSARDVEDKLAAFEVHTGATGCPMLQDVVAGFECQVINAMDAGGATFFLADVVEVHQGSRTGDIMTSTHFRSNAPPELIRRYEAGLAYAQQILAPMSRIVDDQVWRGPVTTAWEDAHEDRP